MGFITGSFQQIVGVDNPAVKVCYTDSDSSIMNFTFSAIKQMAYHSFIKSRIVWWNLRFKAYVPMTSSANISFDHSLLKFVYFVVSSVPACRFCYIHLKFLDYFWNFLRWYKNNYVVHSDGTCLFLSKFWFNYWKVVSRFNMP